MKINIDIINNTLTKNIENKMTNLNVSSSIPCTINQCGWKMDFERSKNVKLVFTKKIDNLYSIQKNIKRPYLTMDITENKKKGKTLLTNDKNNPYTISFNQNECSNNNPIYKLFGIDLVSPGIHHLNDGTSSFNENSLEIIYCLMPTSDGWIH